jgi:hypothetical protein
LKYDRGVRFAVLLALIACGDGPGEHQTVRGEATLETFENRMCKCTDPDCAKQVVADFARWSKVIKKPRGNVEDAAKIMERYNACMTEAIGRTSRP